MSVAIQETVFPHVANGVTVDFAYGCKILDASDVAVFVDDVQVTIGFVVNNVGNPAGGSVTFNVPPTVGQKVRLERVIELKRDTDYQQTGDFLSRIVNPDFDRVWMALQRIDYLIGYAKGAVSRFLKLGDGEVNGQGAYLAMQNRIKDLADPVADQDAANKRWTLATLASTITDGAGNALLQLLAASGGSTRVGFEQTTVSERMGVFQADTIDSKALYYRSVVREIGFRNATTDALKAQHGYDFLYPQSFAIDADADELFVLRGASSGANAWAWIQVYTLSTGVLKRTFTTGQQWRECLVLRKVGASRYLYTIGNAESVIQLDVTALPAELAMVAPANTYAVAAQSMMAFDGEAFAVQSYVDRRAKSRRNYFTLYDTAFVKKGELRLPIDSIGTLQAYIEYFPKMQGIASFNGSYVVGTGSAYVPGTHDPLSNGKLQGMQVFSATGEKQAAGLSNPESMRAVFQSALGYLPTCIENEGPAFANGVLYSLWVTLGPADRELIANEGKGIVITREMSKDAGRLDFTRTAANNKVPFNSAALSTDIVHSAGQLTNPITTGALDTFQKIIDFMNEADLAHYRFSGTNQVLTDINGVAVTATGCLVDVHNINGNSFYIRVRGSNLDTHYWIADGVQTAQVVQTGGTASAALNGVMIGAGGAGKIATGRSTTGSASHHEFWNPNGVVGTISSSGTTTAYNTTSDERLKTVHGDVTGALALLEEFVEVGAVKEASFIADAESGSWPMFLAQKLHTLFPQAVTVGHGEPGDEEFLPWMVDNAKLVPLLVAALVELSAIVKNPQP